MVGEKPEPGNLGLSPKEPLFIYKIGPTLCKKMCPEDEI
jgi:hypothetical protein